MACNNFVSSLGASLLSAGERATALLLRIMSRPSFLADKMIKHMPLPILEKAADRTLDDLGLTRSELQTLIRANASMARSRIRQRDRNPMSDFPNPEGREKTKPRNRSALVPPQKGPA